MRSVSFRNIVFTLTALISLSAKAQGNDLQIWSDAQGLIPASFCEAPTPNPVVNPKLNALLASPFQLADGSVWRVVKEGNSLLSISCLAGSTPKNYVLFEMRGSESEAWTQVGVNADELSIFQRASYVTVNDPKPLANQKVSTASLGLPAGVQVIEGSLDYVVCISGSSLNVRDKSLSQVLFTAKRFDSVKPVQSFGTDKLKKVIGGVEYTFINAEFPSAPTSNKLGWVAENYVVARAQCPGATPVTPVTPKPPTPPTSAWVFPTIQRPTDSYKEGMRRFKASRSGGRLHAACDLYRLTGEAAVAISAGTVIRDRYYFYEGTYALEVKHTGGRVARYGEITGRAAPNVSINKTVKAGQTVGYIGKVNSNCCKPMLHFELYSGTATGSLTQSGNGFNRRRDLMDPTSLLTEWEKAKFGTSY